MHDPGPLRADGHAPSPDKEPAGSDNWRTTHRLWSARRIPAAVAACVIGVVAGAALIDVVAVRAGRRAAAWRQEVADALASRPVDDVWMLTGAALAVVVGGWLVVLALTPGLRRLMPMRSPAKVRAQLDRASAAVLLRDAALRVPGIRTARIRMGRRRILARADVHFRDPQQVKTDLTAALGEERDRLALSRPPRIAVRVRERTH
ncbi:DUF6286 domain-containing protein [Streptomyces collinus]|uniref:DUF6286 domain-containing protein n=1 Tax=Streptomyces collinus TaxID=42684 RepID=UPI0036843760